MLPDIVPPETVTSPDVLSIFPVIVPPETVTSPVFSIVPELVIFPAEEIVPVFEIPPEEVRLPPALLTSVPPLEIGPPVTKVPEFSNKLPSSIVMLLSISIVPSLIIAPPLVPDNSQSPCLIVPLLVSIA